MRFCSLEVQNLVLKIDLMNRPTAVYLRAYGIFYLNSCKEFIGQKYKDIIKGIWFPFSIYFKEQNCRVQISLVPFVKITICILTPILWSTINCLPIFLPDKSISQLAIQMWASFDTFLFNSRFPPTSMAGPGSGVPGHPANPGSFVSPTAQSESLLSGLPHHPALSPNFLASPAGMSHQEYLNAAAQRLSEMQASAALDPLNAIEGTFSSYIFFLSDKKTGLFFKYKNAFLWANYTNETSLRVPQCRSSKSV